MKLTGKILLWILDNILFSIFLFILFILLTIAYNIDNLTIELIKGILLGTVWFLRQSYGRRFVLSILVAAVIIGFPGYLYQRLSNEIVKSNSLIATNIILKQQKVKVVYINLPDAPAPGWEGFTQRVRKIAQIYDFPVSVATAQAALESNRGNSQIAKEKNNYFGLNAIDSDPYNQAWAFDNPEQSIIKYMQLIKDKYSLAYAERKNPLKMIQMIKAGGYASDPNYVSKITSLPEWNLN